MKIWWLSLSESDRRLGILALLGVLGLVVWLMAWRPLSQARTTWLERADKAAAELEWMRVASSQVNVLRGQQSAAPIQSRSGQSLFALAEQSAREAGLGDAFRRAEQDGDQQVRIWFENAPYDGLIGWLGGLQRNYGIIVTDASLDRADQNGIINARLLLVEP